MRDGAVSAEPSHLQPICTRQPVSACGSDFKTEETGLWGQQTSRPLRGSEFIGWLLRAAARQDTDRRAVRGRGAGPPGPADQQSARRRLSVLVRNPGCSTPPPLPHGHPHLLCRQPLRTKTRAPAAPGMAPRPLPAGDGADVGPWLGRGLRASVRTGGPSQGRGGRVAPELGREPAPPSTRGPAPGASRQPGVSVCAAAAGPRSALRGAGRPGLSR